jgi:hypothetical protein
MSFKILYSELQPCVLIACECSARKPYLMLIRALNQTVTCGFCHAGYAIEFASYSSQSTVGASDQTTGGLKIKRTPPPAPAPGGRKAKSN